uniref:Uncharacterized protein n=1 Tax=Tanacetum cinerariifolium TaxID=118510 RepID=A0A6L2JXG8_TANCI|nr:hypothetical protein [Tanacetum cinerariifolium]
MNMVECAVMKLVKLISAYQTISIHIIFIDNALDIREQPSGTDEGAGDKPEVLDAPRYNIESEEESWTFSQGDDDTGNANEESDKNDESEETKSDNDGDDLTHPNLSADDKEKKRKKKMMMKYLLIG